MSVEETHWPAWARRLADQLRAAGKLHADHWHAAVAAIPRHRLVPTVYRQGADGSWAPLDTSSEDGRRQWWESVYSNTVLITAIAETCTGTQVVSSSTQPGLMTRMLESLDLSDGHRVLEIGTGTGYNAALLCHRLGERNVFSVDVQPDLVDTARARLAELGYHPTLVCIDGRHGLAAHAPFDRVIATCSVPHIPWPWVEQTRVNGIILADLKLATGAGTLVRLRREPDKAEGRFEPTYAAFMSVRSVGALTEPAPVGRNPQDPTTRRTSPVDPRTPWNSLIVWFLAALHLGDGLSYGYAGPDPQHDPAAVWLSSSDGSWAEIDLTSDDGHHQVTEAGPRHLWAIVEEADATWRRLGQPDWQRFGLTVTPHQNTLWLDRPDSPYSWALR